MKGVPSETSAYPVDGNKNLLNVPAKVCLPIFIIKIAWFF